MSDFQRPEPIAGLRQCAVCEGAIPLSDLMLQQNSSAPICRRFDCQMWIKQHQGMHPHLFDTQLRFHRQQIRERREQENARRLHRERIEMREAEEDQTLLQTLLDQREDLKTTPPTIVDLPRGFLSVVPVPEQRRAVYRQKLLIALNEALSVSNADELPQDQHQAARERDTQQQAMFSTTPGLQSISDQLCTHCKGGCCPEGGDHAFIAAITLRRQLDNNPALTPESLLQRYLDNVPAESIEGACINQTPQGCALPREWRSDICNSFYCEPVRDLHRQWLEERPLHLFVVQRDAPFGKRYEREDGYPVVDTVLLDTLPNDLISG